MSVDVCGSLGSGVSRGLWAYMSVENWTQIPCKSSAVVTADPTLQPLPPLKAYANCFLLCLLAHGCAYGGQRAMRGVFLRQSTLNLELLELARPARQWCPACSHRTHQIGYRCMCSPSLHFLFKRFSFLNYVVCGGGVGGEASSWIAVLMGDKSNLSPGAGVLGVQEQQVLLLWSQTSG